METTSKLSTFGNLTADPVTRISKNNRHYIAFTVAINPAEGQRHFLKCNVWRKSQQGFAADLRKGSRILLIGKPAQRQTANGDNITFINDPWFRRYDRTKETAA